MKQRTFNILLTVLFCLFIGGMFLGSLILPDRDFSQLENRKLAQTPALSLENITTGKFMEDAEDYVNDQILGRDFPGTEHSGHKCGICQCLSGQCGCAGVFRHHPLRRGDLVRPAPGGGPHR